MQIGQELPIPICSYLKVERLNPKGTLGTNQDLLLKVKENKPKQSWKKAYGPDENEPLITERTHHLADDNQTQISNIDVGRGSLTNPSKDCCIITNTSFYC